MIISKIIVLFSEYLSRWVSDSNGWNPARLLLALCVLLGQVFWCRRWPEEHKNIDPDVQATLLNLCSADTVLIGHSFERSLYALKVKKYSLVLLQSGMSEGGSPYYCIITDGWFALLTKKERIAVHVDNTVQPSQTRSSVRELKSFGSSRSKRKSIS